MLRSSEVYRARSLYPARIIDQPPGSGKAPTPKSRYALPVAKPDELTRRIARRREQTREAGLLKLLLLGSAVAIFLVALIIQLLRD
jgi:hypothetical protein